MNHEDDDEELVQTLQSLGPSVNIIKLDSIKLSNQPNLGSGSFGVVRKGTFRRPSGEVLDCAVKFILSPSEINAFRNEITQLSRVTHPNIVTVYGACIEEPCFLVMEYAAGGSLYNVLHNKPYVTHVQYTTAHALSWGLQCMRGIHYLHNLEPRPLIHRDLKPQNLLLVDGMLTLKICDFGTVCDLQTNMTNCKGSAAWMAPEVFSGVNYTEKCDIYSWGVIWWEILSRQKPFECFTNALQIMWAVNASHRPPPLTGVPKVLSDLYLECWDQDPERRPTAEQLLGRLTRLYKLCDPRETYELHYPIPPRSSTGSMASSDVLDSMDASSPSATRRSPALFISEGPPKPTPSCDAKTPDISATRKQTCLESDSASPTFATHNRHLSGDVSRPEKIRMGAGARPKSSRLKSLGADALSEDTRARSYMLIEPRLQPLPPLENSAESVSIYESHKLKCQSYYRQSHEIELLLRRTRELDVLLQVESTEKEPIREKHQELFKEHESLQQLNDILQKQLSNLRTEQVTDESWVFNDVG